MSDVAGPTRIPVSGPHPYQVVVGPGVRGEVEGLVPDAARQVALVIQEPLARQGRALANQLAHERGVRVLQVLVPPGEAAKTLDQAGAIWDMLGEAAFTRTDVVVGMGGGATTDLAGFVGACWLRGVGVIQLPTSVIGMVDAAVGGKTGINTAAGKNLVGAFHPPLAVVADTELLATLPPREVVGAMGEIIKHGLIGDPEILRVVQRDPAAALVVTGPQLRELIERSVRLKGAVVAGDLKEAGPREILNYGHTFGHAIEKVEGYTWSHGRAVAVGMMFAAQLSHLAGIASADLVELHRSLLSSVGLPTSYRGGRFEALLAAMGRDKKTRGRRLRFVVLEDVGRVTRLEDPGEDLLRAAYAAITSDGTSEGSDG